MGVYFEMRFAGNELRAGSAPISDVKVDEGTISVYYRNFAPGLRGLPARILRRKLIIVSLCLVLGLCSETLANCEVRPVVPPSILSSTMATVEPKG